MDLVDGIAHLIDTQERRGKRAIWRLRHSVTIHGINIPRGFRTDLVSYPTWARNWLPLWLMSRSALLHDYLFNCTDMSRWEANRLFRSQMKKDGVSFGWRWASWLWVSRPWGPRIHWAQPDMAPL